MDINLKILIADDSENGNPPFISQLQRLIKEMFLIPHIDTFDGDNYKSKLIQKDYDLYLIDYNLVSGINGISLIREIRDTNHSLTDIILYSTNSENLKEEIYKNNLDGIFVCDRRDIVIKTKRILEKNENRMFNPQSLRGMVLQKSSDFEIQLKSLLIKLYNQANTEQRDKITKHVDKKINESLSGYKSTITNLLGDVNKILNSPSYIYDFFHKIELLDYFKKLKLIDFGSNTDIINILHEIRNVRNTLGHSQISIDLKGNMIVLNLQQNIPEIYTSEKCKNIRSKLIKIDEILDNVLNS